MFRLRVAHSRSPGSSGIGRDAPQSQAGDVDVMRRVPRGASSAPPSARPGSGYGRPSRPGPPASWRECDLLAQARRSDPEELLVEPVDISQHA
jgi:hypothetical protein